MFMMKINGKSVTLVPIKLKERNEFYNLATQSYGSKFWYDDEEKATRTKEDFFNDWNKAYFDMNSPKKGQCFWILAEGEKIGQINYNQIDTKNKRAELDIIIGSKDYMGKGYGFDALKALIKFLFDNFDLNKIVIEARGNNSRAIRAYQKVGFKKEGLLREEDYFENQFIDCVRLGLLKKDWTEVLT